MNIKNIKYLSIVLIFLSTTLFASSDATINQSILSTLFGAFFAGLLGLATLLLFILVDWVYEDLVVHRPTGQQLALSALHVEAIDPGLGCLELFDILTRLDVSDENASFIISYS